MPQPAARMLSVARGIRCSPYSLVTAPTLIALGGGVYFEPRILLALGKNSLPFRVTGLEFTDGIEEPNAGKDALPVKVKVLAAVCVLGGAAVGLLAVLILSRAF